MSNMSYCRFENTLGDLRDCHEQLEALFNGEPCDKIRSTNWQERDARVKLIELCETIAELVAEERRLSGNEGATVEELVASLEEHQKELTENNEEED